MTLVAGVLRHMAQHAFPLAEDIIADQARVVGRPPVQGIVIVRCLPYALDGDPQFPGAVLLRFVHTEVTRRQDENYANDGQSDQGGQRLQHRPVHSTIALLRRSMKPLTRAGTFQYSMTSGSCALQMAPGVARTLAPVARQASARSLSPPMRSGMISSVSSPPPPPQQNVFSRMVLGAISMKLFTAERTMNRGSSSRPCARAGLHGSW